MYDFDAGTSCTAVGTGCMTESCGGLALIRDAKGDVLASAEVCDSRVREVKQVGGGSTADLGDVALAGILPGARDRPLALAQTRVDAPVSRR